jgi:uncharacterized protein YjdB
MNRAFHSSRSHAQKAARIPSLRRVAWAGALLATVIVLAISFAACSSSNNSTLTSIAVTPATASIAVGGTQQYVATGTYSNGGTLIITSLVTWTSGTPTTATISTGGLATGVLAGTSIITASSGTITGTAVLNVTAAPTLTSIAVTPATATIGVGATQQYTATGTYSDGSMKTLTTETWNSSTPATATISTTGLATGVAAGTTTITATCGTVISPGVTLTVTTATLDSIAVTPATATIAVDGTQQYTATGTFSDGTMSVLTNATWTSSNPAVATIVSTTGLATGVAVGTTTITAMSGTVTSPGVTLTVTSTGGNDSLLNGQYALLLTGTDVNLVDYAFVASITSNGAGTISTGEIDFVDGAGNFTHDINITGTYSIGSDGRGTITLITDDPFFGVSGTTTLGVSMTSDSGGLIIEEDTFATGSGNAALQNGNSSSQGDITGPYDFAFSGVEESTGYSISAAGTFTANGTGGLFSNGVQDVVTGGVVSANGTITGTYGPPDSNGRGIATLLSGSYAYYSVGGTSLYFIENDGANLLAGSVVTQASSPSLPAGSYAFAGGGIDYINEVPLAVGGLFTSDGSSLITSGTLDFNDGGTAYSDNPISGNWTIGSNGRGVITISDGDNPITEFSFYPTASNGIFMLEIDSNNGFGFQSSEVALAQSGTFTSTSLTGPYAINYDGLPVPVVSVYEQDLVGELTSNGASTLTGLADLNVFSGTGIVTPDGTFTGTYDVTDTSGRISGTLTFVNTTQTVEFYVADATSPNTALFISLDPNQVNSGVMESQLFNSVPPQAGHALRVVPAHLIGPRAILRGARTDAKRVPVK